MQQFVQEKPQPTRARVWLIWLSRFAVAGVGVTALAYVPYRVLGERGLSRAVKLEAEVSAQRERIVALRRESELLTREMRALRTDLRAVETVARDDLGMVKEHELVFQIEGVSALVEEPSATASVRSTPTATASAAAAPIPEDVP